MNKKIFTLLTLLLCAVTSSWADAETIFTYTVSSANLSSMDSFTEAYLDENDASGAIGGTCAFYIQAKSGNFGYYRTASSSPAYNFGGGNNHIKLTLASGTFKKGDVVSVTFSTNSSGNARGFYVRKTNYSTTTGQLTSETSSTAKDTKSVTLTEAFDGEADIYINRNGGISVFTVTVQRDAAPAKAYAVTAATNNSNYGTAAAVASSLDEGETTTVTATPKTGYEFTSWAVEGTGASLSSTTTNPTTLTMGTANATVTATFSAINYTIAHNAATGGTYTVSVAGGDATDANTTATIGQTITLAGTPTDPAHTYVVWNVTDANDATVTVTNNQFTMPASNVTIAPVFSEPLNTLFSMTSITGIVNDSENSPTGSVTATISAGSSVDVFNNKGAADGLFYNNNSINLNGSGSSYIHISFPSALQAGDVITATFLDGGQAWKLSKTTSDAASKSNPYTVANNDALLGATDLYIFKDGSAQVTALKIEGRGEISDLAVTSSTTPIVAIGETSTITLSTSSTGDITFSSSDTDVATVSSEGVITGVEGGDAIITILQAADANYRAGVVKVSVTIPEIALVKIKTLGSASTKVTGTIDVATDVTADVNLSSNRKMDKGKYVGFTLNNGYSLQTGDIVEVNITAAGQAGTFKFYNNTTDNPTLLYDTEVAPSDAKTYRFVMPAAMNGVETIYLRRGGDDSGINEGFNPVFGYIAVYRPNTVVTLNASGFATFSYGEDFEFLGMDGAKAYKMTLNESTKAINGTEIPASTKIKAGEGILFKGEAGAPIAITATTGATALEDNDLKGSTKDDGTTAEKPDYCYVLSGNTFASYTGAALAANKAYFAASKDLTTDARAFTITFDDGQTTGIADVRGKMSDVRGDYFDLSGRKVGQPTKGLYIVNGKKVVIK